MNQNFKVWATGYSGFDGGNPHGQIWVCGIEWGGQNPKNISQIEELFTQDVSKIEYIIGYEDHKENIKYTYEPLPNPLQTQLI